jgi:hypothetical protein
MRSRESAGYAQAARGVGALAELDIAGDLAAVTSPPCSTLVFRPDRRAMRRIHLAVTEPARRMAAGTRAASERAEIGKRVARPTEQRDMFIATRATGLLFTARVDGRRSCASPVGDPTAAGVVRSANAV